MASVPGGVFLSYKAEDRARVQPLVEALEAEGFAIWWDQHIGGGSNWRQDIERHLEAARCVIVAWSNRSVGLEGEFVRDEASRARTNGRYLPVRIDPVQPPLGFGETQALDLVGWKGKRSDPRFQALLAAVRAKLNREAESILPKPAAAPRLTRRSAMIGAGAVGVLALGGAGYWFTQGGFTGARRVVVLPFTNMSGDSEQGYFAEGLTEELRGSLSRAGIEVIGKVSSEAVAGKDAATIVDQLGVSHILTGSVRKSPQTMRISAQLAEGSAGIEEWAQTYDRKPGDAIAIQTDIAKQVAGALSVALGVISKAIALGGTSDPQAQDAVFRADQLLSDSGPANEDFSPKAIALYQSALDRDPQYALAWIKLAIVQLNIAGEFAEDKRAYDQLTVQAERNLRRGIAIAPSLAFGHTGLGLLATYRLDFSSALDEFRTVLQLAPNDVGALLDTGYFLVWIGDIEDAVKSARHVVSLDPQAARAHSVLANALYVSGQYDAAVASARRSVALTPDNISSKTWLAQYLIGTGQTDAAVRTLETLPENYWGRLTLQGIIAAKFGQTAKVNKAIGALEEEGGDLNAYQYAEIHAQAGNIEQAFKALAVAEEKKDPGLVYTMRDPLLQPLRRDPRFGGLIKRLNFPVVDPGIVVT